MTPSPVLPPTFSKYSKSMDFLKTELMLDNLYALHARLITQFSQITGILAKLQISWCSQPFQTSISAKQFQQEPIPLLSVSIVKIELKIVYFLTHQRLVLIVLPQAFMLLLLRCLDKPKIKLKREKIVNFRRENVKTQNLMISVSRPAHTCDAAKK